MDDAVEILLSTVYMYPILFIGLSMVKIVCFILCDFTIKKLKKDEIIWIRVGTKTNDCYLYKKAM